MFEHLRIWAKPLTDETCALCVAYRDPRVPWYARALIAFAVVRTFSPIDLIPDFIPVLGDFDDDWIVTSRLLSACIDWNMKRLCKN
jgi:uncharacterized membrane protein YkvA (DUF1232 family)